MTVTDGYASPSVCRVPQPYTKYAPSPTRGVAGERGVETVTYVKAPMPVMARPTMSVCMVSVPSKVWIASRSTMCRMTW